MDVDSETSWEERQRRIVAEYEKDHDEYTDKKPFGMIIPYIPTVDPEEGQLLTLEEIGDALMAMDYPLNSYLQWWDVGEGPEHPKSVRELGAENCDLWVYPEARP